MIQIPKRLGYKEKDFLIPTLWIEHPKDTSHSCYLLSYTPKKTPIPFTNF